MMTFMNRPGRLEKVIFKTMVMRGESSVFCRTRMIRSAEGDECLVHLCACRLPRCLVAAPQACSVICLAENASKMYLLWDILGGSYTNLTQGTKGSHDGCTGLIMVLLDWLSRFSCEKHVNCVWTLCFTWCTFYVSPPLPVPATALFLSSNMSAELARAWLQQAFTHLCLYVRVSISKACEGNLKQ